MKIFQKLSLLPAAIAVLSAVSCVNEPFSGEGQGADGPVASVEQQIVYVKSSASLISSVQTGIDKMVEEIENDALAASLETLYDEFTNRGDALENHIGFLRNDASWLEATMATLEQQKALAYVNGALYAAVDKEELKVAFESHLKAPLAELAESADKWIGASYETYYSVAQTAGTLEYLLTLACRQLGDDKGGLEGLLSDVEAGLRNGAEPSEFKALISVVDGNASALEQLHATVQSVVTELEAEYAKAFEAALSGSGDYSAKTLKKANTKASAELQNATTSLNDLVARIEDCEADIEALKTKVGELKADVEELLGMIQSITFVSDYAEENAVAEYYLDFYNFTEEGYMVRKRPASMHVNFIVRPAATAAALTDQSLWNNGVKVIGYYANVLTKAIPSMFDYNVTGVVVEDETVGLVRVTLDNNLNDDFFYKRTGAKLAMSVTTGESDITSQFVEVVPKNQSTDVYVKSVAISKPDFEIDNGQSITLNATVLPDDATYKTVVWSVDKSDLATIDRSTGAFTAKAVGTVKVIATSEGIDEWGRKLTDTVMVKINPSIRLAGKAFVEEGKEITIEIQSPDYISPEYVTWEVGTFTSKNADGTPSGFSTNQAFASIDDSGKVTGLLMYYNTSDTVKDYVPLMVKCTIEGAVPVVLYHEFRVITLQPLGISIDGMSDTDTERYTKVGTPIGLYGTMKPEGVSTEYFKLSYLGASDGYFAASNVGTTAVTVSIENGGTGKYSYFYPKGKSISRNITVVVEPYYVQTVSLPATFEMNLDQTATLTPTMTSDFEGKDPTYPDLIWTSSAPEIVSINETTGEMTSLKEGTVTITATTSHADAVPSGQAQKSASCVVTVKKPTAPIAIGDYYYSDGTWSTERNYSKTVIGIVFAKVNAAVSDVHMINDHPGCSNGLVVSTVEYTTPMVESGAYWGRTVYFDWMNSNGYTQAQDTEKYSGYGTTKGLIAINSANVSNSGYTVYFDLCEPLIQHRNSVEAPEISSGWYLPSYPEMKLLYDNFDAVNASIQSVGGTVMTKQYTFTDTAGSIPKDYTKDNQYYCTYVNNGSNWTAFNMNTSNMVMTGRYINDAWSSTSMPKAEWPVRIILAF